MTTVYGVYDAPPTNTPRRFGESSDTCCTAKLSVNGKCFFMMALCFFALSSYVLTSAKAGARIQQHARTLLLVGLLQWITPGSLLKFNFSWFSFHH